MARPVRINNEQPRKKEKRMNMKIRKYLGASVLSVALLLAAGIPGLAASSRTVTLHHDAVLSGTSLTAGQYNIRWETHSPEATVQFLRRHKVVLSTEGKIESRDKTYEHDTVVYDAGPNGGMSLVEIRFAGSSQVLVFNQ
jgi:hypothetical protein